MNAMRAWRDRVVALFRKRRFWKRAATTLACVVVALVGP